MNRKGFTLIEVVIAGALSVAVFYAISQMLVYSTSSSASLQGKIQADEDLSILMSQVSNGMAARQGLSTSVPANPQLTISGAFPVSGTMPSYCPGAQPANPQCMDMATFQTTVGGAAATTGETLFTTSCVSAPTISQPSTSIFKALCCPSGTLPRVTIKTINDITQPNQFTVQTFPRAGLGAAACFQLSADGSNVVAQLFEVAYSSMNAGNVLVSQSSQAFLTAIPSGIQLLPLSLPSPGGLPH
jgi:hypothetical protein